MLVLFRFNNFKSFKDEAVLNLVASDVYKNVLTDNVIKGNDYDVLKSVVVYGANASGKSKLFEAFHFMKYVVLTSSEKEVEDGWMKHYDKFRLSTDETLDSSSFEVVFIENGIQYRYGFELNGERILSEWLYRKKTVEMEVLYRDDDGIHYNGKYFSKKIADNLIEAKMIRPAALFISAMKTWNDTLANEIVNWFLNSMVMDSSQRYTMLQLDTPNKDRIIKFMKGAGIDIEDYVLNKIALSDVPEKIRGLLPKDVKDGDLVNGVKTIHKVYDENHLLVDQTAFQLEEDESYGTNRLFALSMPIIDVLNNGGILWVDEADNGLHAELLHELVALFHDPEVNRKNAQLLIATHNISLIDDKDLYRNDQIYLVDKNMYGESSVVPVMNFEGVEQADCIGVLYRSGRLGALPYVYNLKSEMKGIIK